MKNCLVYLALSIFLGVLGCKPHVKNEKNTSAEPIREEDQAIDSTYFFVKSILNESPKEVAKKLGNPDRSIGSSNDCVTENTSGVCTEGTYQNEKYVVEYSDNRLKWIEIQRYDRFNEDVIQRLGFPKVEPTFAGSEVISWRGPAMKSNRSNGPLISIPGIIEISVAKSSSGYFIQVKVESDYNKKF